MNLVTIEECEHYLAVLRQAYVQNRQYNVRVIVCPSALYMERFKKSLPEELFLGAQDMFWESRGSYTGETSSLALHDMGIEYVIIGHSERRQYAGETDETVGLKIRAALKNNLRVVVCVGETEQEKTDGFTAEVIRRQMDAILREVPMLQLKQVIIAYEPRWAIGTGKTPTSDEIMGIAVLLKKILTERYGLPSAEQVPFLYGGSVKADRVKEVCLSPGMSGVLVGRESLIPGELMKIVKAMEE